jgi:O-antigen ligase
MTVQNALRSYVATANTLRMDAMQRIAWREMSVILGLTGLIAFASAKINLFIGITAIGLLVSVMILSVFIRYPRVWLCAVALGLVIWFPQKGEDTGGITAMEYVMVAFYVGGLALWFSLMWFVQRRKLIRNVGDWLLIGFLVALLLNLFVAMGNEVSPLTWFRAALLFVFLLYYFPLREHLITQRDVILFCGVVCCAMFVVAAQTLQRYVAASTNVLYAYQLMTSRMNSNNNMSVVLSIIAVVAALYTRKPLIRILLLGIGVVFFTMTVVSFARMFILATVVGITATLLFFDTRRLIAFGVSAMLVIAIFASGVTVIFQKRAAVALTVLSKRVGSAAKGTKDPSLIARIIESKVLVGHLLHSPLGGMGMGATFTMYDNINNRTIHPQFVHNGYIFIVAKLGIPIWFLLYGWYVFYLARAYICARSANTMFDIIISYAAFASLLSLLLINLTSSIWEVRDGFFMLAFLVAFVSIIEERLLASADAPTRQRWASNATLLGVAGVLLLACGATAFYLWQVRN